MTYVSSFINANLNKITERLNTNIPEKFAHPWPLTSHKPKKDVSHKLVTTNIIGTTKQHRTNKQ